MKFKAEITVMPLDELLDPQGKVVSSSLHKLEMQNINNVRIGKHITMEVDANLKSDAEQTVKNACEKLLVNKVIEKYTFQISELK